MDKEKVFQQYVIYEELILKMYKEIAKQQERKN